MASKTYSRVESRPKANTKKSTKIKETLMLLLRALGLSLILKPWNCYTGHGLHEHTKIAICKDRIVALLRGLIHVVPIGIALGLIILNWNTYYVGVSIYDQALYQLMAKALETLIQASLANILFSYIRHEMIIGNAIPFGALFCGLSINQLPYLWSLELWGSIRSTCLPFCNRLRLIGLIIICVMLAAVSGPSSAVLLVPRLDYWPAGSSDIWVNATIDELYPLRVNSSNVPSLCLVAPEDTLSNECPSSEWEKIQQFSSSTNQILSSGYQKLYYVKFTPEAIELFGKTSLRQLYCGSHDGKGDAAVRRPVFSSTTQATVSDAITDFGALWYLSLFNVTAKQGHGSPLSQQSDAIHSLDGESYQPFSISACDLDTIEGDLDDSPVSFPVLDGANALALANANLTTFAAIKHPTISRAELLDTPGNTSEHRLRWVNLPQDAFNGSSIGAVVLFPREKVNSSSPSRSSQDIALCNLSAGWGRTSLTIHTFDGSTSIVSYRIVSAAGRDSLWSETHLAPNSQNDDNTFTYNYPSYPQRHINISADWAQYLNPIVKSVNRSVFDLIMQEQDILPGIPPLWTSRVSAETALASMMANGLARFGFSATLQGSPKTIPGTPWIDGNHFLSGKGGDFNVDPQQSKDWVKLHINSTLQGYAYNTDQTAPKIAIAFLTMYCIVAFTHLLYLGISGISSTCWDSIAEVTALAMNSAPTAALRNTCAGISEFNIFKLPVRVLPMADEEGDGQHLELVFGNVSDEKLKEGLIKVDRAYGTMHSSKEHVE